MSLASAVSTDKHSNWHVHLHCWFLHVTYSTLCSISNSCSNYKIPEGLVINCEDASSGPREGGESPWLTFGLSESIYVSEDAVQRRWRFWCALWSLHSRGYVGLSEFNPHPPTPTAADCSSLVAQPAADADSRISCLCTRWAWLLITELEIRRWSRRNWWWLWNNTNPIRASVLPQTDRLTDWLVDCSHSQCSSPPSSHHHWSTLIIRLPHSTSYTRSLSHISTVLCHRGLERNGAKHGPHEMITNRAGQYYIGIILILQNTRLATVWYSRNFVFSVLMVVWNKVITSISLKVPLKIHLYRKTFF